MESKKILFADDDPEIREVVRILLEGEGYSVVEAENGEEAVKHMDKSVDLVILDMMMPARTGISACMEIRKSYTAPILFLTAKSQDSDKTMGFSAGGDDYLVKPFSYAELVARVKALLRRYCVYKGKEPEAEEAWIRIGGLSVNQELNQVFKEEQELLLTELEYRILALMAKNRRKIFTIQNLYESVWEEPYFYNCSNTVMVHIRNLRKKLEDDPQNPRYIKNVWGKGYRIE